MAKRGQRQYDPDRHCGAKTRAGRACVRGKGERTDHLGQGRCWLHGGRNRIKHGLYSQITRPGLRKLIDEISETDADLMDLEPELILLKALTTDFANRYDEFQSGIAAWHQSWSEAVKTLLQSNNAAEIKRAIVQLRESTGSRPKHVLDISAVSLLVDRIGKTVERMHKIQSEGAITRKQLKDIYDKMLLALVRHCSEEQMTRIEDDWRAVTW